MRNKIKRKLNSRAGESISETLVSLLIASLALVMLAGTLTASSGMITKSRAKMKAYYDANEDKTGIVKMLEGGNSTNITIADNSGSCKFSQSCKVTYFKNTEFGSKVVIAYKPSE